MRIISRPYSKQGGKNYEAIFKKNKQPLLDRKPYVTYDAETDALYISTGSGKICYVDEELAPDEWDLINWDRAMDTHEIVGVEIIGVKNMLKHLENKARRKR